MKKCKKVVSVALAIVMLIGMMNLALAANFSDTKGHWSESYVDKANNNGLVNGVGDGRFNPDATVSAAEWATMVVNLFYAEERDANRNLHEQRSATHGWWYPAMVTAAEAGLLRDTIVSQGAAAPENNQSVWNFGSGNFSPTLPMSRYDMAQVIHNLAAAQDWDISGSTLTFPDYAEVPTTYRAAVNYCYNAGFITGVDSKGTFAGSSLMTRGSAAVVLCRLFDAVQQIDFPMPTVAPTPSPTATPVPTPTPLPTLVPTPTPAPVDISLNGIALSASLAEATEILGVSKASYDYDNGTSSTMAVYHDGSYHSFFLIGFQNDTVQYIYAAGNSNTIEGSSSTVRKIEYTDSNDDGKVYAVALAGNAFPSRCTNEVSSEKLVYELTNAFRVLNGASALSWDGSLGQAAHDHTQNMFDFKTLTHDGLGALTGKQFWVRATEAGYAGSATAENCSMGHYTPFGFVDSWVNSSGHRSNMLTSSHRHLGVGVVGNYSTQVFGQ